MRDYGIVLGQTVRDVYLVESGFLTVSLMVATIYQQQPLRLVLTREIYMPNATAATVSYTQIFGDTLEDLKRNLDEMDLMLWRPLPDPKNGQGKN